MKRKTHTINAQGKSVGRVATQIAKLLQGKHKPSYLPNQDRGDFVKVKNVEKMEFTGKKLEQKKYFQHSGYPGIKEKPMKEVFEENPDKVLFRAVAGMIPKNKLHKQRMQRIKFE